MRGEWGKAGPPSVLTCLVDWDTALNAWFGGGVWCPRCMAVAWSTPQGSWDLACCQGVALCSIFEW